jgi:hypothetical protein
LLCGKIRANQVSQNPPYLGWLPEMSTEKHMVCRLECDHDRFPSSVRSVELVLWQPCRENAQKTLWQHLERVELVVGQPFWGLFMDMRQYHETNTLVLSRYGHH